MHWGFLGPEVLPHERRVRTLGLGAVVRNFNEIAVPGMGGVWFGKQLLLPLLGISVAQAVRAEGKHVSNIEVANAIEAVACLSAYKMANWRSDPRLRGGQKLRNVSEPVFAQARKRSFYVSQPMRMSAVEPLLALGFVDGDTERFNAMRLSRTGSDFLECALSHCRPNGRSVATHLLRWVRGDESKVVTGALTEAISPLTPMPAMATSILREQIEVHGPGSGRRKAALRWVGNDKAKTDWSPRPTEISEDHWRDLRIGAKFFLTRDASLDLLDAVEHEIALAGGRGLKPIEASLTPRVTELRDRLRDRANAFLEEGLEAAFVQDAKNFCLECMDVDNAVTTLTKRDGRVLRYRDDMVVPGAAFDYSARVPEPTDGSEPAPPEPQWPPGISRRVDNLFWMSLDLRSELDKRIGGKSNEEE
ncbi:hypothetical protein ACN9MC_30905 [Ensifer adhaerens]|uniref:hypothetical protein n=1 Tax=Ensifer adhaerens TaxID=106592 RepID=UPI003CF76D03